MRTLLVTGAAGSLAPQGLGAGLLYAAVADRDNVPVVLFGGDRREHRDDIELLPLVEALADPTTVIR